VVDQRVAVALELGDRHVAMALVLADRFRLVPLPQHPEAVRLKLARHVAHHVRVAQQEVQRRSGDRPLARIRLEAVSLALAAVVPDRLLEVVEVEVRDVPPEAVAARLAREQVVEVALHRLVLVER